MSVWPQPGTDCHRLLEALADGDPHSFRDLYRLGLMVHSRSSDCRRRGYVIKVEPCRDAHGDRDYHYTLVSSPLPPAETSPGATSEHVLLPPGDSAGENGHQLTLEAT